jgi:diaminopimelate epimerase
VTAAVDGVIDGDVPVTEPFFKYHGLGNDFVILDRRASGVDLSADAAVALCDRRRGIGADGVLVLLPGEDAQTRARMVVHNADGSVPEMCGNGLRCAVKYLVDHGPDRPTTLSVDTGAGKLACTLGYDEAGVSEIAISMGPARLVAPNLPSKGGTPFVQAELAELPGARGTAVSMGNPHLIYFDLPLERAGEVGPVLEHAKGFDQRTNVELARMEPDGSIRVVVWERGCGLTQACGTGACATAAAAVHTGRAEAGQWIPVHLPGGTLAIRVTPGLSQVELRGGATHVFEGVVTVPGPR